MSTATHETYAEWLSREMEARGFSTRSLARAWKPEDFETARRSIRRYLGGVVPIERTRVDLARALGSDESGPSEPSDKEGDLRDR